MGLVRLTDQPNVRRAFYFGLAAGFLCYAPQLFFFWNIFSAAAIVLWLVLAFWVGLFTAIVCGCIRRWGKIKAAWLIPIIWTGIEYFRSELYYLKFSWLNVGYAFHLPMFSHFRNVWIRIICFCNRHCIFFLRAHWITCKKYFDSVALVFWIAIYDLQLLVDSSAAMAYRTLPRPQLTLVGVQMEFPPENVIPKMLDQALAKNTNAPDFRLERIHARRRRCRIR